MSRKSKYDFYLNITLKPEDNPCYFNSDVPNKITDTYTEKGREEDEKWREERQEREDNEDEKEREEREEREERQERLDEKDKKTYISEMGNMGNTGNTNETNTRKKSYTSIDSLNIKNNTKSSISFLDNTKNICKCICLSVDYDINSNYCCYWDRHPINITPNIQPIGCPVEYVPDKITKTFKSELNHNTHKLTVNTIGSIDEYKKDIPNDYTNNITYEKTKCDYFKTDGIFCSFNCVLAYINENRKNPMYIHSIELLYEMYRRIFGVDMKISSAPHWKMLSVYGGKLSIQEFRNSFNNNEYKYKGEIFMIPIGNLYTEIIKL